MDESLEVVTWVAYGDAEIVEVALETAPEVVAVDAPLSLPRGRRSLEERSGNHLRVCDEMLLDMGIRFFPVTLGPMRALTARGMRLRDALEGLGLRVIEVFPGGAQDALGIPRKNRGLEGLREGLRRLGIRGIRDDATGDELDAVTAAYVGLLYVMGAATVLQGVDGHIVMPPIRPFTSRHVSAPHSRVRRGP